jgi:hypothetical protein
MKTAHIISTTDAINGFDVSNLKTGPHVVEGHDANDLTICFENEASRQAYIDIPVELPEQDLSEALSNPADDYSS